MQYLLTPQGEAALAATLHRRPLLAFDFDGTLAPIVPRPDDAHIPRPVAERLALLAARLPVAIVSGRSIDDVRRRIDFVPHYIVGNHGAEDGRNPAAEHLRAQRLDALRARIAAQRARLERAGVLVEDKGQSLALHYRLARSPQRALAAIRALLADAEGALHVFSGKMVENVVPVGAPDKAAAVHALVQRSGARSAVFAGDDVNDEPVFAAAPPHWLTVRVGRDGAPSQARYYLESSHEMLPLLERMLAELSAPGTS